MKYFVTQVEYKKAKDIVERYEAQQERFYHSDNRDYERLLLILRRDIPSMPTNEKLVSTRLFYALRAYGPCLIEDFTKETFMELRNVGIGTWNQFCKYRRILSEIDEDYFSKLTKERVEWINGEMDDW